MKVGDLVTHISQRTRWHKGQSVSVGLIVETGKFMGGLADVKVLWKGETTLLPEASRFLTLVEDYLTTA
jgi:hypothetical protein